MKKLAQYVFLLALIVGSAYFSYRETLGPCDKPLEYSIGRFDTQFGISKEEFKTRITIAEEVWEKVISKDVFIYNPDAKFKINLIYDERQLATVQKQKTEFGLLAVENAFKEIDTKFNLFKNEYDQEAYPYEQDLASFKKRKAAYDTVVAFWNKKGGVPEEEYQALETERRYLNAETKRLNSEMVPINNMTAQLNTLLKERNLKASEYNKVAQDYNKKYNGGLEFNQADYTGSEINIYQFSNKKDLTLALSHELGHALGMDHVENSKSIMYYLTGINVSSVLNPSTQDLAELNRVCEI